MINRDDLTPEQREVYDASYVGHVDRLDREWVNVKQALYDALPKHIRWLFVWLIEDRRS